MRIMLICQIVKSLLIYYCFYSAVSSILEHKHNKIPNHKVLYTFGSEKGRAMNHVICKGVCLCDFAYYLGACVWVILWAPMNIVR